MSEYNARNTFFENMDETIQRQHEFEQWRVQETERLERKKQKLHKQKRQMDQERLELDIEKRRFKHQQEFAHSRNKNEEHLLDMKRQLLENELYKLAEEKKQFEQKKDFYRHVDSYQKGDIRKKPSRSTGRSFLQA